MTRSHSNESSSNQPPNPPSDSNNKNRVISPRMEEFQKKLRGKTPIGKLDQGDGSHPYQEKEPLQPWPNEVNPHTGEIGKMLLTIHLIDSLLFVTPIRIIES